MSDWNDFAQTTNQVYGVDMNVLEKDFDREQREYHLLSSRWTELPGDAVLAEPCSIKRLDMATCTLADARGIVEEENATFEFDMSGTELAGPISGISGWFTADFTSRTDAAGAAAPRVHHPAFLSTGPENGYTHWGQQTFYFLSSIPLLQGEVTRLSGSMQMVRTKENARLYNCRLKYHTSRHRESDNETLMKSNPVELTYQIP